VQNDSKQSSSLLGTWLLYAVSTLPEFMWQYVMNQYWLQAVAAVHSAGLFFCSSIHGQRVLYKCQTYMKHNLIFA